LTSNGGCNEFGICTNTQGSFNCKCKDGYEGNGFNCNALNNEKSENNQAIGIGVGVGVGVLALCLLVLLILFFTKRKNVCLLFFVLSLLSYHNFQFLFFFLKNKNRKKIIRKPHQDWISILITLPLIVFPQLKVSSLFFFIFFFNIYNYNSSCFFLKKKKW